MKTNAGYGFLDQHQRRKKVLQRIGKIETIARKKNINLKVKEKESFSKDRVGLK